jgi:hypothetical protein
MIDEKFLARIKPHQRGEALYCRYHADLHQMFDSDPRYRRLAPYIHYTNNKSRDLRIASDHFRGRGKNCLVAEWRPNLGMFMIRTKVSWGTILQMAEQHGVTVQPLAGVAPLPVHFNFDANAKGALAFWVNVTLESIRVMDNG